MHEFTTMIEGYNKRIRTQSEKEWRQIAQLAAWTLAPHSKGRVTAEKLLGNAFKKNAAPQKTTPEESKRIIEELEQEFENKRR
jgi:hypothetical protein